MIHAHDNDERRHHYQEARKDTIFNLLLLVSWWSDGVYKSSGEFSKKIKNIYNEDLM